MVRPTPNFELTTGQVFVHFVPMIRELAPFSSLPGASPFLPCFAPFLRCLPSMRCNVDENCLHLIGPFTAHKSSLHFDLWCTAFNAHPWFKCAKEEQHLWNINQTSTLSRNPIFQALPLIGSPSNTTSKKASKAVFYVKGVPPPPHPLNRKSFCQKKAFFLQPSQPIPVI